MLLFPELPKAPSSGIIIHVCQYLECIYYAMDMNNHTLTASIPNKPWLNDNGNRIRKYSVAFWFQVLLDLRVYVKTITVTGRGCL
jgi:hypothetical protein